jgi:hypothetical protein
VLCLLGYGVLNGFFRKMNDTEDKILKRLETFEKLAGVQQSSMLVKSRRMKSIWKS